MLDVTARGRSLYEYDQAAWHATDAVQALHPPDQLVGRYIALKSDKGWIVAFGHLSEQRDKLRREAALQHRSSPRATQSTLRLCRPGSDEIRDLPTRGRRPLPHDGRRRRHRREAPIA